MNYSYEVSISAFCLCCARLYMRRVKDFQAGKDSVDNREACPTCSYAITEMLKSVARIRVPVMWFTVNRL